MNCYYLLLLSLAGMLARSSVAYRPTVAYDVPHCGELTGAPKRGDCHAAFLSITLDNGGRFMTDDYKRVPSITKTHGTCTVHIYSSDHTVLTAGRQGVSKPFTDMLDQCKDQSGRVLIQRGTSKDDGYTIFDISG